jgi:hypothetical protein
MFCWRGQIHFFLLRLFCWARRTMGSSNSIRLSVISISFGLFLLAYDFPDYGGRGDCAFAGFSRPKNEITPIASFEIERLRSPRRRPLQLDQAASGSACHSFGAADDIHLGKDRFYVRFHRAFADE